MYIAPFLLESPTSQRDDPPGWKVFTGALTREFFKASVMLTCISTVPVAAPRWVLQEHTLTGGHVKHRGPDRMSPALCESRLCCAGLPFPVCLLALPAPCASPHCEYKATVCSSVLCCMRHRVTPLWLRSAEGSWIHTSAVILPSLWQPQPLQTSVLQL